MPHPVGHFRLVMAGAVVVGLILGGGLTMLLMAKDKPFQDCVRTEIRGQLPGSLANVQRLCAERHGIHVP
jgi:hypothetical protein